MKEKYEELSCEIVVFDTTDVITTSLPGDSGVQWGGTTSA